MLMTVRFSDRLALSQSIVEQVILPVPFEILHLVVETDFPVKHKVGEPYQSFADA